MKMEWLIHLTANPPTHQGGNGKKNPAIFSRQDQGLGLHELTVLAATLEHLIHDEVAKKKKTEVFFGGSGGKGYEENI